MNQTLYHIFCNDVHKGPFTLLQLQAMWRQGLISADSFYWFEGASDWQPILQLTSVLEQATTTGMLRTSTSPVQSVQPVQNPAISNEIATKPYKGTSWLWFWNYIALPLHLITSALAILAVPATALLLLPYIVLVSITGYGLHIRRLWGWRLNWFVVGIFYLSIVFPTSGAPRSPSDFWIITGIKFVIGALIWIWPNMIYWQKRRCLFT